MTAKSLLIGPPMQKDLIATYLREVTGKIQVASKIKNFGSGM